MLNMMSNETDDLEVGNFLGFRADEDIKKLVHNGLKKTGWTKTKLLKYGIRKGLVEFAGKRIKVSE